MCLTYWEVDEQTRGNRSTQEYVKIGATNTTKKYSLNINQKNLQIHPSVKIHGRYSDIILAESEHVMS